MKGFSLLFCFALPIASAAQNPDAPASVPVISAVNSFFALSVADIEESTRWYRDKLGLKVIMKAPRTDVTKSAATVLQGGGLTVELVQHDEAAPLRKFLPEPRGALFVHGIFKVGVTVDDFDTTIAALRSRGISIAIGPFPKRPDQPANAIIQDNAGNYIQIFGKPD